VLRASHSPLRGDLLDLRKHVGGAGIDHMGGAVERRERSPRRVGIDGDDRHGADQRRSHHCM
jgi:hypothetical protein